jgi:hypothetical protein
VPEQNNSQPPKDYEGTLALLCGLTILTTLPQYATWLPFLKEELDRVLLSVFQQSPLIEMGNHTLSRKLYDKQMRPVLQFYQNPFYMPSALPSYLLRLASLLRTRFNVATPPPFDGNELKNIFMMKKGN